MKLNSVLNMQVSTTFAAILILLLFTCLTSFVATEDLNSESGSSLGFFDGPDIDDIDSFLSEENANAAYQLDCRTAGKDTARCAGLPYQYRCNPDTGKGSARINNLFCSIGCRCTKVAVDDNASTLNLDIDEALDPTTPVDDLLPRGEDIAYSVNSAPRNKLTCGRNDEHTSFCRDLPHQYHCDFQGGVGSSEATPLCNSVCRCMEPQRRANNYAGKESLDLSGDDFHSVEERHNFALVCDRSPTKPENVKEATRLCQGSPWGYYCNSVGSTLAARRLELCDRYCRCQNLYPSSCVLEPIRKPYWYKVCKGSSTELDATSNLVSTEEVDPTSDPSSIEEVEITLNPFINQEGNSKSEHGSNKALRSSHEIAESETPTDLESRTGLQKRHNYALVCDKSPIKPENVKDATRSCQALPYGYYCTSIGTVHAARRHERCDYFCRCQDLYPKSCVLEPSPKPYWYHVCKGSSTEDVEASSEFSSTTGMDVNTALPSIEGGEAISHLSIAGSDNGSESENGSHDTLNSSNEAAKSTTTDLESRELLEKRHNYALVCDRPPIRQDQQREVTMQCQAEPHRYSCNKSGKKIYANRYDRCEYYCRCINLEPACVLSPERKPYWYFACKGAKVSTEADDATVENSLPASEIDSVSTEASEDSMDKDKNRATTSIVNKREDIVNDLMSEHVTGPLPTLKCFGETGLTLACTKLHYQCTTEGLVEHGLSPAVDKCDEACTCIDLRLPDPPQSSTLTERHTDDRLFGWEAWCGNAASFRDYHIEQYCFYNHWFKCDRNGNLNSPSIHIEYCTLRCICVQPSRWDGPMRNVPLPPGASSSDRNDGSDDENGTDPASSDESIASSAGSSRVDLPSSVTNDFKWEDIGGKSPRSESNVLGDSSIESDNREVSSCKIYVMDCSRYPLSTGEPTAAEFTEHCALKKLMGCSREGYLYPEEGLAADPECSKYCSCIFMEWGDASDCPLAPSWTPPAKLIAFPDANLHDLVEERDLPEASQVESVSPQDDKPLLGCHAWVMFCEHFANGKTSMRNNQYTDDCQQKEFMQCSGEGVLYSEDGSDENLDCRKDCFCKWLDYNARECPLLEQFPPAPGSETKKGWAPVNTMETVVKRAEPTATVDPVVLLPGVVI